ncbi:MAG: hypothetical protein ACOX0B_01235 [Minisyncoccales bacterium]|jgi:membrane protein insertase Oxa1/YidC/SpoIIIJ
MGIIFTIIGAVTAWRLWESHIALAIITIIATLYQMSSLNEMRKEREGIQKEDKIQTLINMITTIIIIILFIYSFF